MSALDGSDIEQWRARALAAERNFEDARLCLDMEKAARRLAEERVDDAEAGHDKACANSDLIGALLRAAIKECDLAESIARRALVEGLAECERLRADGPTVAMRALFAPNEVAAIRADAAREERARVVAYLRRHVADEVADAIERNEHAPSAGGEG